MLTDLTKIKDVLESTFPINGSHLDSGFRFFPICNEYDFDKVIADLAMIPAAKNDDQIKVAMLFGESHFLSLLPTLAERVDLIILADIENKLHIHNRHLLETFKKSETISTFLQNYCVDFPAEPFKKSDGVTALIVRSQIDVLFGKKSRAFTSLKQHHFLSSISQYRACKEALQKVAITQIQLNLIDRHACQTLAGILAGQQAQFSICNFTNIHQFVDVAQLRLSTMDLLYASSPECILYSTGSTHHLKAQSTTQLEHYFDAHNEIESTIASNLSTHRSRLFETFSTNEKIPKIVSSVTRTLIV